MAGVGSSLGFMIVLARGKTSYELFPVEQILSQVRQLLVTPRIKVPLLHFWFCLVRSAIVVVGRFTAGQDS